MKKSFVIYAFIIFLTSTSFALGDSLAVPVANALYLKPFGGVFVAGDALNVFLDTSALMNKAWLRQTLRLEYELMDKTTWQVVYSGETRLPAGRIKAANPVISLESPQNGLYLLRIKVWGGLETASKTIPFSVVPESSNQKQSNDVFGVCTHFGKEWVKGSYKEKARLLQLAGVGWVRDEMEWQLAETKKGVVKVLPQWDEYVDACIARGIKPLIILSFGNQFYDQGGAPYTEEGQNAFVRYVEAIVSHFKGRVENFEIWNEYNMVDTPFNPTGRPPEDYLRILKAAYTKIKAIHPKATVIGGSMAHLDYNWLEEVFRGGGADYMDAVSMHLYCYPRNPEEGELRSSVNKMTRLINRYKRGMPIWLTEIGWPTNVGKDGVSEVESADSLIRAYVQMISKHNIAKIFWYDFENDFLSTSDKEANFGLLRNWSDPVAPSAAKRSYLAYGALTKMLSNATFVGYERRGLTHIYKFNQGRNTVWVAWSESPDVLMLDGGAGVKIYDSMLRLRETGVMTAISTSGSPLFIEMDGP